MRPPLRNARLLGVQLVLLGAVLAALATLQYRWIGNLADAERQRRSEDAELIARRVMDDLSAEVHRTFEAFLAPEDAPVAPLYAGWKLSAPQPDLVGAVYVAEREGETWSLHRMHLGDGSIVPVPWTPSLDLVREHLAIVRNRRPAPDWPPPLFARIPGLFIVQRPAAPTPEFLSTRPYRMIFVQFGRDALSRFITAAAGASAAQPLYDVALVAEGDVIGRSSAEWPHRGAPPEAAARLPAIAHFENVADGTRRRPAQGHWDLVVRHRSGGLEAIVAASRRRNLVLSAVVLLILGASVAMLAVLVRRAEHLRAQQTAFVSMMTHELNTPVAVIRAAGENLQDGIVTDREQLVVYGRKIVEEAERLRAMTADIIALAGSDARAAGRTRERVPLAPVVHAAVERCRLLTRGMAIELEVEIEPDLPDVDADRQALGRAVENLIVNAIRHGGSGGWVAVRARRESVGAAITVEDRGPGIDAADAAHLFDAFYRGSGAAFTDGVGLGLAIVRQTASEHGGSVTLDRTEGGAAFSIHLPAAVRHA